jgi:hypothetical protein
MRAGVIGLRGRRIALIAWKSWQLCAEHLRALVGRRLGPHAFEQIRRQLTRLDLNVTDIFLLHEAFYDEHGRALQPAEWL